VAEPKFRPGQVVRLRRDVRGFEGGPYEILRLMPDEGGEHRYRVREVASPHERVFAENELMRASSEPPRPPVAGRRPTR
jgi:hypothetical protein